MFVTDPPDIAVDPPNRAVREGNNATLSCNVRGNPEPSITWTIDGFQVNTTINPRISFSADEKQLTITNAKRTDNGNYRCVANNSLGIATSDAATVDVQCKYKSLVNGVSMTQGCHVVRAINHSIGFRQTTEVLIMPSSQHLVQQRPTGLGSHD